MMGSCGAEDCYPSLQARAQGRARAGALTSLIATYSFVYRFFPGEATDRLSGLRLPSPAQPEPKDALSSEQFTEARGSVSSHWLVKCLWPQVSTAQDSQALLSTCMQSRETSPLGPSSPARTHPHFGGSPTKAHILPTLLAEGPLLSPRCRSHPGESSSRLSLTQSASPCRAPICCLSTAQAPAPFTSASLVTKTISGPHPGGCPCHAYRGRPCILQQAEPLRWVLWPGCVSSCLSHC